MLDVKYASFLQLCKDMNYTQAAEHLNVTQPTVSKHIQRIERDLDVKLFYYDTRNNLKLTQAGQILLVHLGRINQEVHSLKQQLAQVDANLRIGASFTIGNYLLPDILLQTGMNLKHIELTIDTQQALLDKLSNYDLDVLLLTAEPLEDESIHAVEVYQDEIVLACSMHHFLAQQKVPLQQLQEEVFVMREPGSGINHAIDKWLKSVSANLLEANDVQMIGHIEIAKRMVMQRDYLGFFYRVSIEEELAAGKLSQVFIEDMTMQQKFYLVTLERNWNRMQESVSYLQKGFDELMHARRL